MQPAVSIANSNLGARCSHSAHFKNKETAKYTQLFMVDTYHVVKNVRCLSLGALFSHSLQRHSVGERGSHPGKPGTSSGVLLFTTSCVLKGVSVAWCL